MRAREPDHAGHVERDGVRIGYEVFGEGERTILLMPTWAIIPSGFWKGQVPQLARRHRVITFDARGSGRSDRPGDAAQCGHFDNVDDAIAVLDEVGGERALVVATTHGACNALALASLYPERVAGLLAFGPCMPALTPPFEHRTVHDFETDYGIDEGWARENRYSWARDYRGFLEFFFGEVFPEPHSTKQIEDCVAWGVDIGREMLQRTWDGPEFVSSREHAEQLLRDIRCPVLVVQGTEDRIAPGERFERVAELTGARLVVFEGAGHN
ncbi:MAG: hypothetical protein QOE28_134, partial [Solirubrobacteraceae bacterium]|nr:hypothetical protein [Solirubrobacteraceae bacterium]